MRSVKHAAAAVAALAVCGAAPAQTPPTDPPQPSTTVSPVTVIGRRPPPPPPGTARLELYEERDLRGGGVILVAPTPSLLRRGFADRARSARAVGAWQICDGADFAPPCVTIEGDVLFLGEHRLSERAASARPLPGS